MNSGRALLEQIRQRPAEFLEQQSLRRLIAFDTGYSTGCACADAADPLLPANPAFDDWMSDQLAIPSARTNRAWWGKLLLVHSDQDAFAVAFDYFVRFRACRSEEKSPPRLLNLTWESLFASLRKRPAMYLGDGAVTLMRAFWDGYGHAARAHRPHDDPTPILDRYSQWLSRDWGGFGMTYRWEKVLLFAHSAEQYALEQFFITFDQFRASDSANPSARTADIAVAS